MTEAQTFNKELDPVKGSVPTCNGSRTARMAGSLARMAHNNRKCKKDVPGMDHAILVEKLTRLANLTALSCLDIGQTTAMTKARMEDGGWRMEVLALIGKEKSVTW